MFLGYCFQPSLGWTPKVQLPDAEAAYRYCFLQHQLFPEVRITDAEDYCVMQVKDHILYVPHPDDVIKRWNLASKEALPDCTYAEAPQ